MGQRYSNKYGRIIKKNYKGHTREFKPFSTNNEDKASGSKSTNSVSILNFHFSNYDDSENKFISPFGNSMSLTLKLKEGETPDTGVSRFELVVKVKTQSRRTFVITTICKWGNSM